MKRALRPFAAFLCVALLSPLLTLGDTDAAQGQPRAKAVGAVRLVGTWRLVSYKYGDAKEFAEFPRDQVKLKHITPAHFSWIRYDAKSKQVQSVGGGTYTHSGDEYTEHLEYALGDDVLPLIGKDQTFTIKVEGDKLHQTGALSTGYKIEEMWEREKPGVPQDPAGGKP